MIHGSETEHIGMSHDVDLLEAVRHSCAKVAHRAREVAIRRHRVVSYACELAQLPGIHPSLDPHAHYLGHGTDTLAFFVILDTINFGSGYFPLLRKRSGMSGYFTIATSLTERCAKKGPWSAAQLSEMTRDECTAVFGQENSPPEIDELMALYSGALQALGALLLQRYDGECAALIAAAGHSANRLVGLLSAMPLFRDIGQHHGIDVSFYKRAQLMAADLALAFDGKEYGLFTDLDRLTMFADNLVPHVLRVDGILEYEDTLLERIEGGDLIAPGSPEEVEIRACAVHAVELLVREMARLGKPTSAKAIDYLLWTRGQGAAYKALPRHRTRTTSY